MRQRTRTWLLVFVLLGLGSSATALWDHYRVQRAPVGASFPASGIASHCETVYQSRFATFRGIPVSLGGLIWFVLALLLTPGARARSDRAESDTTAYLLLLSIPAVSLVLFFTYASVIVLNALCIWHVLTSIAVVGVFVTSGAAANTPFAALPGQMARDTRALAGRPVALLVAILFVAAAASAVAFFPRAAIEPTAALVAALAQQPTDFDLWFESQVRAQALLPAGSTRVLIVKFNDYLSAACAEADKTARPVIAKYQAALPGQVEFIVRDYPQDPECNSKIIAEVHEAACEAAAAVRLAEHEQRGAAMQEWLYTHQAGLTPAAVRRAAKEIGHLHDFDEDYARAVAPIRSDVDAGHRLGVETTPTFFINGVRIEGALKAEFLEQAIAHELRVTAAKP